MNLVKQLPITIVRVPVSTDKKWLINILLLTIECNKLLVLDNYRIGAEIERLILF